VAVVAVVALKYVLPICGFLFGTATRLNVPTPLWITWAGYLWSAGMIGFLGYWLFVRKTPQKYWYLFRGMRPLLIAQAVGVVAVTIGVAFALYLAFPFLNRSWLYLLPGMQATNVAVMPLRYRCVAPIFLAILALSLPELAWDEEITYRRGTRDWRHAIFRSLRFGLAHCVVGVPLFVGLALTLPGLWFTHQYFRGGVERSATHHAAYNLVVLAAVAVTLFVLH
jgi:hypothetical protein